MQRNILWENRECSSLVWRNPIINLSNVKDTTRCWGQKYCCSQRIALPEIVTHVASVGDRSAVNFMLKLSCFYFCKWLLPIQDVEIRQCSVPACSTTRRFSTGSVREMQTTLGKGQADLQCNSVLSQNWVAKVRTLLPCLYKNAVLMTDCLNRMCFSLYWQY